MERPGVTAFEILVVVSVLAGVAVVDALHGVHPMVVAWVGVGSAAGLCVFLWVASHIQMKLAISGELAKLAAELHDLLRKHERAEKRFRLVVEAAPNGMVMIDRGGGIVLANAQAHRMFGYESQTLIGATLESLVPERFRARHPGHRDAFFANPQTRSMGEGRELYALRKDGTEFPVEIGLNPIETEDGVFVLAAVVDITARRISEEALKATNRELRERTGEMEQFVYTVSHDLKSPVVSIMGILPIVEQDLAAGDAASARESLRQVIKSAERLGLIIRDLLELSRIGRIESEPQDLDTTEVLGDLVQGMRGLLEAAGARVRIQQDLPRVRMPRVRLVQVFENLLTNAVKYGCTHPEAPIEVGGTAVDGELRFWVRDHGPGVAPEYQEKIFGLFQRLHADSRGTGVGLTIVRRIVETHGGRCWVESRPGQGATFWFTLPFQGQASAAPAEPQAPKHPAEHRACPAPSHSSPA